MCSDEKTLKTETLDPKEESIKIVIKSENFDSEIKSEQIFPEDDTNNVITYSLTQENLGFSQEFEQNLDKNITVKNESYSNIKSEFLEHSQELKLPQDKDTSFNFSSPSRPMEPEQFRKVFIGGLSYKTNEETLSTYFSKYGELVDHVVMKDKESGKSRGFGFVTYSNSRMVDELMKHRPHVIDGRQVEPKRATPREDSGRQEIQATVKKLYIGGIRDNITEEDLVSYFGQYGTITDSVLMKDKETNKTRGFAFITFDDYDSVDKIILKKHHSINHIELKCEKAIPKENSAKKRSLSQHSLDLNAQFNPFFYSKNCNDWMGKAAITNDFQIGDQFPQYAESMNNSFGFYNQETRRTNGPIRAGSRRHNARSQGPYARKIHISFADQQQQQFFTN